MKSHMDAGRVVAATAKIAALADARAVALEAVMIVVTVLVRIALLLNRNNFPQAMGIAIPFHSSCREQRHHEGSVGFPKGQWEYVLVCMTQYVSFTWRMRSNENIKQSSHDRAFFLARASLRICWRGI